MYLFYFFCVLLHEYFMLCIFICFVFFFFFKQKTAYEMRISDWSSDVCSSDLRGDRQCAQPPVDRRDPRPRASVGRRRDHRERCDAGGGDGGTDHRLQRPSERQGARDREAREGALHVP